MPLVSLGADRISATAAHTKGTLALARASRDLREPSPSRDLLVLTWSRSFPARGTGDEIAVETIAPPSKRPAGPRGPHGRHSPVTALQATSAFGSRSTRSEASDGHGEVGGQLHCASPLAAATRLDRSAAERSPEVGLGDESSPHGAMATLTLATFVLRVLETLRKSSERAKEKENVRRAGVEPTTSSARTSPRCLRGGPRRSLYKRQHTHEDKGDLDSEKKSTQKSVQKSVQKSREFLFSCLPKITWYASKKGKKKGCDF